ncbi:MAG: phosphoglycerate kinase [Coriobacteriales bacterium]|jgi:phosphoglycerate kinase|nr:phosphoglycerate kinase [Coriobacteriales bacterium]
MQTIDKAAVAGKRVLMRVDFNVPIADGTVTDDTRIRSSLPTIEHLLKEGASVILLAHLGRPEGDGYEKEYSMAPVARVLGRLIDRDVKLVAHIADEETHKAAETLVPGEVMMLENLRFDPREKQNDEAFARELASLADLYVNDAFGAAHRAHASMAAVTEFLPSYAGFLLAAEVDYLGHMLEAPERPFVAILGGSKVSDKIQVIDSLLDVVDVLIIGGAMCFTFLLAKSYSVGISLKEEEWVDPAAAMLNKAAEKGVKLLLPVDVIAAESLTEGATSRVYDVDEIPDDLMGLDVGPVTCELFSKEIAAAHTVYWNGPMGVFELKHFENGTRQIARAVAKNEAATTVIGGGDSIAAVKKFGYEEQVTFISTGGGASMRMLEGKPLPCVEALKREV